MENIRLAFQGIWGHKMRSFLTMLGIIIGIASIITIVSTIKGTNEQIKENLIGSGSNVVQVSLYQDDWEYDMTYSPLPDGVRCLEDSLRDTLNQLSGVEEVSFFNRRNWSDFVTAGSNRFSGETYGIDSAFFRVNGYTVTYGRDLTSGTTTASARWSSWTGRPPPPSSAWSCPSAGSWRSRASPSPWWASQS